MRSNVSTTWKTGVLNAQASCLKGIFFPSGLRLLMVSQLEMLLSKCDQWPRWLLLITLSRHNAVRSGASTLLYNTLTIARVCRDSRGVPDKYHLRCVPELFFLLGSTYQTSHVSTMRLPNCRTLGLLKRAGSSLLQLFAQNGGTAAIAATAAAAADTPSAPPTSTRGTSSGATPRLGSGISSGAISTVPHGQSEVGSVERGSRRGILGSSGREEGMRKGRYGERDGGSWCSFSQVNNVAVSG